MPEQIEPPDGAYIGLVDETGETIPLLFERDDDGCSGADRWYDSENGAYTWPEVLLVAGESGRLVVRLYREDDPAITVHAEAVTE